MKSRLNYIVYALFWVVLLLTTFAVPTQSQTGAINQPAASKGTAFQLAAGSLPVSGSGTIGRLTKWTGLTSASSIIGDSTIFESKFGLIGIGTDAPTSKLTVQGMIETTMGGYKFPDGTVQTTAGIAPGQAVSSLNGLTGNVVIAAGPNITITPNGNGLTISAPNSLSGVAHDATLAGDGTGASPLKIAVPLSLIGPANQVLRVENTGGGVGVRAIGGGGSSGGTAVIADGGSAEDGSAGEGVVARGGGASVGDAGAGVRASGGDSSFGTTGFGLFARGGNSLSVGGGGIGVLAQGGTGNGSMSSRGGDGIVAQAGNGLNGATEGLAGKFLGNVEVVGNFNVTGGGTKNFKIDHPLDPENKFLYHAAIESSEVLNIYTGNVTTDENGYAVVTLPDWFEAVNRDFRYQLTVIGSFAQAIVGEKIKGNRFSIKSNAPGVEVSWLITGIRSDAAMLKHPFNLEEDKQQDERGFYLTPSAYGKPEERGLEWARNQRMTKQLRERR